MIRKKIPWKKTALLSVILLGASCGLVVGGFLVRPYWVCMRNPELSGFVELLGKDRSFVESNLSFASTWILLKDDVGKKPHPCYYTLQVYSVTGENPWGQLTCQFYNDQLLSIEGVWRGETDYQKKPSIPESHLEPSSLITGDSSLPYIDQSNNWKFHYIVHGNDVLKVRLLIDRNVVDQMTSQLARCS